MICLFNRAKSLGSSVTRYICQNFEPFARCNFFGYFVRIRLVFDNFAYHCTDFHCCKQPNSEQIVQPSGYTAWQVHLTQKIPHESTSKIVTQFLDNFDIRDVRLNQLQQALSFCCKHQCDQIGLLLKSFGDIFSYKISPNIGQLYVPS